MPKQLYPLVSVTSVRILWPAKHAKHAKNGRGIQRASFHVCETLSWCWRAAHNQVRGNGRKLRSNPFPFSFRVFSVFRGHLAGAPPLGDQPQKKGVRMLEARERQRGDSEGDVLTSGRSGLAKRFPGVDKPFIFNFGVMAEIYEHT